MSNRISLARAAGNNTLVSIDRCIAQKRRQIFNPRAEFPSLNPWRIILGIFEDAENLGGKVRRDILRHASEALHEKCNGLRAVEIERTASAFSCVLPWVEVVQPTKKSNFSDHPIA